MGINLGINCNNGMLCGQRGPFRPSHRHHSILPRLGQKLKHTHEDKARQRDRKSLFSFPSFLCFLVSLAPSVRFVVIFGFGLCCFMHKGAPRAPRWRGPPLSSLCVWIAKLPTNSHMLLSPLPRCFTVTNSPPVEGTKFYTQKRGFGRRARALGSVISFYLHKSTRPDPDTPTPPRPVPPTRRARPATKM